VCDDLGHRIWRRLSCRYGRKLVCLVIRFCTWISLQPPLWSWTTWLYHKKGNLTQNSTVYCAYGNTVNFSHMSRMHFSASLRLLKPMHAQMPKNATNHARNRPFPEARGLPSNTRMLGPTPLTTPNDSSIALRTSTTQQSPHWLQWDATNSPPNCPFPFDDHHQNLIHPYQARPHSLPQTASRSNHPCHHCSHVRTDRWNECSVPIALRCMQWRANNAQSTVIA